MTGTVHIIGAGLAGLSAAVCLIQRGASVVVHDAAGHGGGRCRSYHDEVLGCRIDNGNHLMLSGNHAILDYLKTIGSEDTLVRFDEAEFPFLDLSTGQRWSVTPDKGIIPWSLFSADTRVPGSSLSEYLRGLSLAWAGPNKTISQCLGGDGPLFDKFWDPLAVSVLNTESETASAQLLWPVLRETFGRGSAACVPMIVRDGLSESFVDPAVAYVSNLGGSIHFNHRLRAVNYKNDHVTSLDFGNEQIAIGPGDRVILAVPPSVAHTLMPEIVTPDAFRPIVNGHFRVPKKSKDVSFMGLVGSIAHWLFVRGDMVSITVSAATDLVAQSNSDIADCLWSDICIALDLGDCLMGEHRIVKEKRATFAQTPEQLLKRSGAKTQWKNLALAGDWTATGLPATIEGTIRSGNTAASFVF